MTNAKRGRGSRHGFYLCAVAALGFALSGCGGGASGAAGSAATSQAATTGAGSGTGLGSSTGLGASTPPTASTGVTINWQPPTENTDGSALTNLAGYDIHYGTKSGNYTQTVSVSNPGVATYVVDNLSPGTYYFAVAAVNASGTESSLSSEVTATVN
ncbi:MAG: fibronectin type III domain-containing protein [Gammaproteobacteria bacterium]|nr:fibronectin type III domain-containing protein [Gammaproteobacteria bacterium]